jgi:diguanylate cyclase (GGDEF)-like protein
MRIERGAVPILADLAVRTALIAPGTGVVEVEAVLRDFPGAPGVLTVVDGVVCLIDRPYFDSVLSGRLGYGRALLHRRPLGAVVRGPALVLPASTTWDDAARAALARPADTKGIPVVVDYGDGYFGIAPVGPLVEYLSNRYEAMALRDELTGLGNRRMLIERSAALLADRARGLAVMVIDLNRFKEINDTLGHARGDDLLRHVAAALRTACAPGEAFRLGGDEFVVLAEDHRMPTGAQLEAGARRLLQAIRGPFPIAGIPITVEASLGVAHSASAPRELNALLAGADSAMYRAKHDRTQVEVWDPQGLPAPAADLSLQAELRTAIALGQLVLHYQPLVDARTRQVRSVEALVRWAHPRRGLLSPSEFVPQAELSDVIHLLTERVLADAIDQAARWRRGGWPIPVAVNLAAPVLTSDHIVTTIERLLIRAGLPAAALIVEVTESAVMTRPEQSARRLRAIRAMGVRIAMDDFGTGYTSLALLSRLPLDEIKLDRTFVMRVHHQQERVIVEAVARMANGLGLTLVAEGVEDEETARTLTAFGVDLLQGFHFGRPLPAGPLLEEPTLTSA